MTRLGSNQFEFTSPDKRLVPDAHPGCVVTEQQFQNTLGRVSIDTSQHTRWDGTKADYCEMVAQLEDREKAGAVETNVIQNKRDGP